MLNKKLIACAAIGAVMGTSGACANTLSSYEDIAQTLMKGNTVMLTFDRSKCSITPQPTKADLKDRLVVKFRDLVENHNSFNGGKDMRLLANSEMGLFGNKQFIYYRALTLIYEDGTVMVFDDGVDPATYKLEDRTTMTCKLTKDGSGGVVAATQPA